MQVTKLTFSRNIAPDRIRKFVRTGACLRPSFGKSPYTTWRSRFLDASITSAIYGSFSLYKLTNLEESKAGGVPPGLRILPPEFGAALASFAVTHSSRTACNAKELIYVPRHCKPSIE